MRKSKMVVYDEIFDGNKHASFILDVESDIILDINLSAEYLFDVRGLEECR